MRWFKHDSNANTDAKLRKVRIKYGMEGYGLYWYCLELVASTVEKHNLTFELEHDAEVIAHDTGIHFERVEEMMRYMVNLNLFEESSGRITCLKMANRTDEYTQKLIRDGAVVPRVSGQSPDSVGTKSDLIEEKRTEENRKEDKQITSPGGSSPPTPYDQIIDVYHRTLPELPAVRLVSDKRKRAIKVRHRDVMDGSLENWERYFSLVRSADFLMGKVKDWRADFDFLITEKAITGVIEGKYHGNAKGNGSLDPNERGISGAERTRRARELARQREQGAGAVG